MDFQIITRRTGIYLREFVDNSYHEYKLPNEKFPLEYFKKVFDETPQTEIKINCLAATLFHDAENYVLTPKDCSYILNFENAALSMYILDKYKKLIDRLEFYSVPDNVIYTAAEYNYNYFISKVIHLVPQRTKNAALGYAANWGNLEIVKVLIDNGAEVKSFNGAALRFAKENGQRETVEYLLSCGA